MRVYEVKGEPFQKDGEDGWFLPCEVMVEGEDDFRQENIRFPVGVEQAEAFKEFVDTLEERIEQHVESLETRLHEIDDEIDHFSEMLENRPYVVLTESDDESEENGSGLRVVH